MPPLMVTPLSFPSFIEDNLKRSTVNNEKTKRVLATKSWMGSYEPTTPKNEQTVNVLVHEMEKILKCETAVLENIEYQTTLFITEWKGIPILQLGCEGPEALYREGLGERVAPLVEGYKRNIKELTAMRDVVVGVQMLRQLNVDPFEKK